MDDELAAHVARAREASTTTTARVDRPRVVGARDPVKPPAGRPPRVDLDAERAVIAEILEGRSLDVVRGIISRPRAFFDPDNQALYRTVIELAASGTPIDLVSVAGALRAKGFPLGARYLASLVDTTPAVASVEPHARRVAALARQRAVVELAHRIAAEGYDAHDDPDAWARSRATELLDLVEPPAQPAPAAVAAAWSTLPAEYLSTAPDARRWLLRHPTENGQECAPGRGDGLFPLGKVGLLVADGGVGKTMALVALAVSVIVGRRWFGHFEIGHEARTGRVLLALAEEDADEVHRRIYDVGRALQLTDDERARVADRLVVLPLAGRPVSLLEVGADGRTLQESAELRSLRECLTTHAGEHGWSLVALDPLARWGTEDTETDNAAATRTLQAVETLAEAPGGPAVLVAHHTSAANVRLGTVTSRGATGIRNGARWEASLTAEDGDVYFKQTKSNYSRPWAPDERVRLVRGPRGVLRVPTEDEDREREVRLEERATDKLTERDRARDARREARLAEHVERVVAAADGTPRSGRELADAARILRREDAVSAVNAALAAGRLEAADSYRGHPRYRRPR